MVIDRDFYGYKRFSYFLLSMPGILNLECRSNSQHFVRGVALNVSETNYVDSLEENGDDEKPLLSLSMSPYCSEQVEEPPVKVAELPPNVEKVKKICGNRESG